MEINHRQVKIAKALRLIRVLKEPGKTSYFLDHRFCTCGCGGLGWGMHDYDCPIYQFHSEDYLHAIEVLEKLEPDVNWRTL